MKVSGFTFIRNARKLNFPAIESIKSILPICDEFIVNVGDSDDDTLDIIKSIGDPKIRIVTTKWNDRMRARGFVYGQQKTIAHFSCTGDWAFYLEGDEVVHEDDLQKIHDSMKANLDDPRVESLIFDYVHFYGNHKTYLDSPAWYRRAPRIIRNTIRAWAPGGLYFIVLASNKKGRYPYAAHTGAKIYHYGWARPEEVMNAKIQDVKHYWNKDAHATVHYRNIDPQVLREFTGAHPAVMESWLPKEPLPFRVDPDYKLTLRERRQRIKMSIERLFKVDLSKKHFKLVK